MYPDPAASQSAPLKHTPLHELNMGLGARLVPFAGYAMPVQYHDGIIKEHLWTRTHSGLFDVSHMGQALLVADDKRHETAAAALEALVPADLIGLKPGQQRYTQLLNETGGIIDDMMVTRPANPAEDGALILVLNAARTEIDVQHIAERLPAGVRLALQSDRALIALQGPATRNVMSRLSPDAGSLGFMTARNTTLGGIGCHASCSGYTGEDGFEISVRSERAYDLTQLLLNEEDVKPIGLGARDSLRLEAGLCLYGHDLDETISPIEAALAWSIQKRRREQGGFPGAARITRELEHGPQRLRVGIKPEGRAPAREGTEIFAPSGERVGIVTSGGFAPSINGPVAMGYVTPQHAAAGAPVSLLVRNNPMPARVVHLPFVPHRYHAKANRKD